MRYTRLFGGRHGESTPQWAQNIQVVPRFELSEISGSLPLDFKNNADIILVQIDVRQGDGTSQRHVGHTDLHKLPWLGKTCDLFAFDCKVKNIFGEIFLKKDRVNSLNIRHSFFLLIFSDSLILHQIALFCNQSH